jgi:hypothetical protein
MSETLPQCLKFNACVTNGLCQFRDPTMKLELSAIKLYLFDACRDRLGTKCLADYFRRVTVAAVFDLCCQISVTRARGTESFAQIVVNQLTVNVLVRSMNGQTWTICRATDLLTNPVGSTPTLLVK